MRGERLARTACVLAARVSAARVLAVLVLAALVLPRAPEASLVGELPLSGMLCESSPAGMTTVCVQAELHRDDRREIWLPLLNPLSSQLQAPRTSQGGQTQPFDLSFGDAGPSLLTGQTTSDDLVSSLFADTGRGRKGELIFGPVMPLSDFIAKESPPAEEEPPGAARFFLVMIVIVGLMLLLYCNALIVVKYFRAKKRAQRRRALFAGESASSGGTL